MKTASTSRAMLLLAYFILGPTGVAAVQERPLWAGLEVGPHSVGFRSLWTLDYGRTFASTFEDGSSYGDRKAPRPILVNIWYPARGDAGSQVMEHREYLEIGTDDPGIDALAGALNKYNRDVIAREITGQARERLDPGAAAALERLMSTPTAAVRDAPEVGGRFPVVIYHSGHGSSFEDNSVLCEYLASHGYIVLGSAFQRGDGDGLGTDTRAGSTADLDALIRFAHGLSNADWGRIGLVGHSGGAQHALVYAARPGSAVNAFVLLDTTQDYYSLDVDFWPYTEDLLRDRDYVTAPLLVVANPHAFFQVADSLSRAERYYLTVRELGHSEFISQGVIASTFGADGEAGEGRSDVGSRYRQVARNVRRFLDGYLQADSASLTTLRGRGVGPIGGPEPHVEYVPRGVSSPPPYAANERRPPTPRQFRPMLEELGADSTITLLGGWRRTGTISPILDAPTFATALLFELVEQGRRDDAVALYGFFEDVHPDLIRQFLRWYDVFESIGDVTTANVWLGIARVLDPTNPEVLSRSTRS